MKKLLTTTALSLLLVSLAGGVYGQVDIDEIWKVTVDTPQGLVSSDVTFLSDGTGFIVGELAGPSGRNELTAIERDDTTMLLHYLVEDRFESVVIRLSARIAEPNLSGSWGDNRVESPRRNLEGVRIYESSYEKGRLIVYIDRDQLALGETLTYTIRAYEPTDEQGRLSAWELDFSILSDRFDVLEQRVFSSFRAVGGEIYSYKDFIVSLRPLIEGELVVPSIEIDGVETDPIVVSVKSSELLQAASGSGFAVSYEGHIITNNHVIEGCENVRLHKQGTTIDAVVISRDSLNDLAVIKADFSPAAVFAIDNSNPQLMQDIYVAGYPFGQNISSSLKVTRGIVSALTGIGNNFSNMQIDAAIQPGNSGGPIFDEGGNVIGVAVATLDILASLEEFGTIPQNTNFGVKANVVSNFLVSNGVEPVDSNTTPMSTSELGQLATDATYYLSCWMTTAQIQQMSSNKVMFQDLGQ